MEVLATTDETHGGHTVTAAVHAFLGSLNQLRVVGKTEVVVCAEVEANLATNHDLSALCALNDTFTLVEAIGFNLSQFLLQIFLKVRVHCINVLKLNLWPQRYEKH